MIQLSKNYTALLDEVYKAASLTSVLDSDPKTAKQGAKANEIMIPKISMDGLADYSRNSGYVNGDVSLEYETVQFNYDRGRKLSVDYLDNEETAEVAFGQLNAQFLRTKVAPEADAFAFATLCGKDGISTATGTLSTGADVIAALAAAVDGMTDDEVPTEDRVLFITSALNGLIRDMDTTKSREVMAAFSQKVVVPQGRFYTAIDLLDGTTSGETAGGYRKHVSTGASDAAGKDINFMIVHKPAVLKFNKHIANNIITPEENQDADAYAMKYRKYGLVDAYENKVAGIYVHHKA